MATVTACQAEIGIVVALIAREAGDKQALIDRAIALHNGKPRRRITDSYVQGWTYVETGEKT